MVHITRAVKANLTKKTYSMQNKMLSQITDNTVNNTMKMLQKINGLRDLGGLGSSNAAHPSRVANISITSPAHHKTGANYIKMMEPLKNHTIQPESTILNLGS